VLIGHTDHHVFVRSILRFYTKYLNTNTNTSVKIQLQIQILKNSINSNTHVLLYYYQLYHLGTGGHIQKAQPV